MNTIRSCGPRVDVVILTWNDPLDELGAAIASAVGQSGVDARVLVVDNGSEVPVRPRDPRVEVLRNPINLGVGGGRNLGADDGDAPYVCFLDSDARLHPGALAKLLAPLVADPNIGLSAPVFTGQRPEASAGRAPTLARKLLRGCNRSDVYARTRNQGVGDQWDVDFAIGACQVFRREAFERVGGLDASADFGPEDVDFCLRVRAAGWRVVQLADAGCDHPPRRAFRGLLTRRGLRHSAAVVRHLWRHRRPARPDAHRDARTVSA